MIQDTWYPLHKKGKDELRGELHLVVKYDGKEVGDAVKQEPTSTSVSLSDADNILNKAKIVKKYYADKIDKVDSRFKALTDGTYLRVFKNITVLGMRDTFTDDYYKFCRPDSKGTLKVTIAKAERLPKLDAIGKTDAYVKVILGEEVQQCKSLPNLIAKLGSKNQNNR
jgi:hypothetical protein